jgi:hypothetical protein
MYITISVNSAADEDMARVNRKFINERNGIPLISGIRIKDIGIAAAKAIIEINIINDM